MAVSRLLPIGDRKPRTRATRRSDAGRARPRGRELGATQARLLRDGEEAQRKTRELLGAVHRFAKTS